MKTPEEVAREALGNIAGPLRHIFGDAAWLDALDVLLAQEAEHLADLIRARDAEVRDALQVLCANCHLRKTRRDGTKEWGA